MCFNMEATWKTKDEGEILIKNMTDSHLINCINLIRKRKHEIIRTCYGDDPDSFDVEDESYFELMQTKYQMMLFFAYTRGLKIENENV